MLIYATVVMSLGWYPRNGLLLAPLFNAILASTRTQGHRAEDTKFLASI
jgi:hypothetical protein